MLGAKCGGVYALVDEDCRSSAPTISQGKITAFGKVRYTLDGSDPRFSANRKQVATGGTVATKAGETIKVVAFGKGGKLTSDVAEATDK